MELRLFANFSILTEQLDNLFYHFYLSTSCTLLLPVERTQVDIKMFYIHSIQ